ncbi:MAG: glycosyltransferase family 4 protein [Planctomycetota bacterium]
MRRILHLLSQRPKLTGSGVTLDELLPCLAPEFEQAALVGVPHGSADRPVGIPEEHVRRVTFARERDGDAPGADVSHRVVGMSDVMPYPTRTWRSMTRTELANYRAVLGDAVARAVDEFRPDLLHAHHAWVLAATARERCRDVPLVVHGHGSDLRQFELVPEVGAEVARSLARADAVVALHRQQAEHYAEVLGVPRERVHVVGAGFAEERFAPDGRELLRGQRVVFVGKTSAAKGVDALLLAFRRLRERRPRAQLVLVGSGSGEEGEELTRRARGEPGVLVAGRLDDADLVRALRSAAVLVLPSLWEGLPLVLLEGAAAGALLVATDLPGVVHELAPTLGEGLVVVRGPRSEGGERCAPGELEPFAERLSSALDEALRRAQRGIAPDREAVEAFTWPAVARRVAAVWEGLLAPRR